ncbi:MAG: dihydropteroate synthase [Gammaproteobacteria bacterium]|nr:dihydropteroate synthase [Gammaproteobacteria bacterium]MBV9723647.1 dihydropteroate synthase [Gammaproteobacteria bacterium]
MPSAPVLLRCAGRTLDLSRPLVMGVLNVTPDSFSDGGRFASREAAIEQGLRMAAEGAALIDVGGESTRPGAEPVGVQEELQRVLPVIEQLRRATTAIISVDTSKPEVMAAAAAAGAGFINDVRALREPGALEAAAASGCGLCLMHMQGDPRTMQAAPSYRDVVAEVREFLGGRVAACRSAGIDPLRISVDPGFGFGKTLEHNLTLLRHLSELAADGIPVLVGLSRKSTVGKLTGRDPGERVYGSVALAVIAALNGARIIRAHDVGPTVDALKVAAAVAAEGED